MISMCAQTNYTAIKYGSTAEDIWRLERKEACVFTGCAISVCRYDSVSIHIEITGNKWGVQMYKREVYAMLVWSCNACGWEQLRKDVPISSCRGDLEICGRGGFWKTLYEVVKHDFQTVGFTNTMKSDKALCRFAVYEKTRKIKWRMYLHPRILVVWQKIRII